MHKPYNPTARYQTIKEASMTTGFSQKHLRKLCVNREIPLTMVGRVYMIDVPAFYEQLEKERKSSNQKGSV